jgi:PAS domain S-box-containing protein
LENADIAVDYRAVSDLISLRSALHSAWDAVLCRLPTPELLLDDVVATLRASGAGVPVVFIGDALDSIDGDESFIHLAPGNLVRYLRYNLASCVTIAADGAASSNGLDPLQVEAQLRESQNKFQALVETTSDFIWEMDAMGRYTYCSPQMEKLWGLKPKEMIGKSPFDVMPEEHREQAMAEFLKLAKTPRPFIGLESAAYVGEGRLIYIETNGVPFFDFDSRLLGFRGISRDITERKLIEETLERRIVERNAEFLSSEKRYRDLFQSLTDSLVLYEPVYDDKGEIVDLLIVDANPASELPAGQPTSQYIGRHLCEAFPGFERTDKYAFFLQVAISKMPGRIVHQAFLKDLIYESLVYPTGENQIAVISKDITPVRRAEEELRRSVSYTRGLIEASLDPLVTISEDGKITDVNKATEKATGVSRKELIGTDFSHYFTEPEKAREGYQQVLRDGAVTDYPLTIKHVSGTITDVVYNATTYTDESGKLQGVFAAARDITELKKAVKKALRLTRVLSILTGINETIVRIRDRNLLFQEACRIAVEHGGMRMAWVGTVDEATGFVQVQAAKGVVDGYLDRIRISARDEAIGKGPTGRCIRENRHAVCVDFQTDPRMAPWRDEAFKRGFRSSAAFPLRSGGKVVGAFTMYAGEPGFFDAEEVRLLLQLADDISLAVEFLDQEENHRLAEEQIRLDADQYSTMLATVPDGFWRLTPNGTIMDVNETYCRMIGYSREELLSMKIDQLEALESSKELDRHIRKVIADSFDRFETRHRRKDGSLIDVEVSASFWRETDQFLLFLRDITARKRAEDDLRESERRLRLAQEIGGTGDFEIDLATGAMIWSDSVYTLLRLDPTLGQPSFGELRSWHQGDSLHRLDEALRLVTTTGEKQGFDRELLLPSGERVFHHVVYVAVKDKQGKVAKVRGTIVDITRLKLNQIDLQRMLERTQTDARLLEDKNVALREVLTQIEVEKDAIRRRFTTNVEQAIMPSLIRMSEREHGPRRQELELLIQEVRDIVSPFIDTLRSRFASLSPREVEICRMIKGGLTSKEIAEALNIAPKTVQKYRELIRRKLKLTNKDANLRTFLESMPS